MRKNLPALVMTLAFAAWLCGCATPTDENAIRLAVTESNNRTETLYQVAPFRSEDGKLWMAGNHWVWDAHVTADGHEFTSKVTFDRSGTVATVLVQRH